MAGNETLDIYQELINRNAVPTEQRDTVDELIRRGVLRSAQKPADPGILQTIDNILGEGAKYMHQPNKYLRQFNDAWSFGFYDKGVAAAKSAVTGKPYADTIKAERAATAAAGKETLPWLVGQTAGNVVQGIATLPKAAALGAQEAMKPAVNALAAYASGLPTAIRYGGAYGAANAAGHADGAVSEQVGDVLAGAGAGAVLGPAVYTGLYGAGGLARKAQVARERWKDANAARLDEARGVGIDNPLPAIVTDGPVTGTASRIVGAGIGGNPVGARAAENIGQMTTSMNRRLSEPLQGQEAGDLGRSIQGDLRRAVVQRSRSSDELQRMSDDQLQVIAGRVTDEGFVPPRPRVDPVRPRDVDPVQPRDIGPEPVAPESINTARQYADMVAAREREIQAAVAEYNQVVQAAGAVKQRYQPTLDAYTNLQKQAQTLDNQIAGMSQPGGYIKNRQGSEGVAAYRERIAALQAQRANIAEQMARMEPDVVVAQKALERYSNLDQRVAEIRAMAMGRDALERSMSEARGKEAADNVRFERARSEYDAARQRAMAEAEADTARLREQARLDAENATIEAERAAQRQYEQNLRENGPGFRSGGSGESYSTELGAAYELAYRSTPKIQTNPLGDGYRKTATTNLFDDVAKEGKRDLSIRGFKGKAFDVDGNLEPVFVDHLRSKIGNDLTERFVALSELRRRGPVGQPGVQGMRGLLSDIRRTAREVEKTPYGAQPRSEDAALLRRLEAAVRADLYESISKGGSQLSSGRTTGERAVSMLQNVDQQYVAYVNEIRRPLVKVFGDNVDGVQAMDRLVQAARRGETGVIGAYMRAMSEKNDPVRGASAVIYHMTGGGRDLSRFLSEWRELPPVSRRVLFQGAQGQALERELNRYVTVGERLERFTNASRQQALINPSRVTHLLTVSAAYTNLPLVLASVGGNAVAARVLSSPRLVRWMTTMPEAARGGFDTQRWAGHMARLSALAKSDQQADVLQRAVIQVVSSSDSKSKD